MKKKERKVNDPKQTFVLGKCVSFYIHIFFSKNGNIAYFHFRPWEYLIKLINCYRRWCIFLVTIITVKS